MREPRPRGTLLYLHVPKAGGTTLSDWLFNALHDPHRAGDDTRWLSSGVYYFPSDYAAPRLLEPWARVRETLATQNVRAVLGHFRFGLHAELPGHCRYITMLRDPVDRIASMHRFHLLLQAREGSFEGVRIPASTSLEDFVRTVPYAEVDNGQVRRVAGFDGPPGSVDEDVLALAKSNLASRFDAVGLTERFDESLLLFARALGLAEVPVYYPRNVVATSDEEPPPAAAADAIRERCRFDVALHDFARSRFDDAVARGGDAFRSALDEFRGRKSAFFDEAGGWDMPERFRR